MHFTDYFAIIERYQEILNPISHEKLMQLGETCGLREGSRVLDIGSGKGYLLRIWAKRWNIRGVGIDINKVSLAHAREKAEEEGLGDRLTFLEGAAKDKAPTGSFDVVTCIGAPFAIGSYREAVSWMAARTVAGGSLAIGDQYLPAQAPAAFEADLRGYLTLVEQRAILEKEALEITGLIAASQDDWDRYASGGWRAGYDWLRANPEQPDYHEVTARLEEAQKAYLSYIRQYVGWAIFLARKNTTA